MLSSVLETLAIKDKYNKYDDDDHSDNSNIDDMNNYNNKEYTGCYISKNIILQL